MPHAEGRGSRAEGYGGRGGRDGKGGWEAGGGNGQGDGGCLGMGMSENGGGGGGQGTSRRACFLMPRRVKCGGGAIRGP